MEINLKVFPNTLILDDAIANGTLPEDNSTHVTKNVMDMLSKLPFPLGGQYGLEHGHNMHEVADSIMLSHFLHIFQELAEIQDSIQDLTPALISSHKRLQPKILSYASAHKAILKSTPANELNPKRRPFLKRLLHHPIFNFSKKKKSENIIHEELQTFYVINGLHFRPSINSAMMRCARLEKLLYNMKDQMKHPPIHSHPYRNRDDGIAGLAFELGLPREQLSRWGRDVDHVWREVRSVRRRFDKVPSHKSYQTIFAAITRQNNFRHYF